MLLASAYPAGILFGRCYTILTVEIGALDRAVIPIWNAHISPVNVTGFNIDNDAVGNSTVGDNDFSVRPVGVSRMNPTAASFQEKQTPGLLVSDALDRLTV